MFEATSSERTSASPGEIWALWADPGRWPEWNEQLESVEADGDLVPGADITVKYRGGGRMRFSVTELEAERLLVCEAKLPGCRFGQEHRVEPDGAGAQITHRTYLKGITSGPFSVMFSRRKLRRSVAAFIERERELVG